MAETALSERTEQLGGRELPASVLRVLGDLRGKLDGELAAIGYADDDCVNTIEEGGMLRRWDARTGRQMDACPLNEIDSCWVFSHDGRQLASGSDSVSIWEVTSGALLHQLQGPTWMLALAFSPDGKTLASGHDDNAVRIWDAQSGKLLATLEGHNDEVCTLAFNGDGTRLASAGEDRVVVIWDVNQKTAIQRLLGHTDRVDALAWSPGGDRIASAGWDTSVRVWDPASGELLAMLNGQGECVHCVAFLPDQKTLACGDSDCVVRLWDFGSLKVLAEFRGHHGAVKQIAVSPDGTQIATGGVDRCVQFWSVAGRRPAIEYLGPTTPVHALARVRDELAVLHAEGQVAVWSLATGRPASAESQLHQIVSLAASPAGLWAVGTLGGAARVFKRLGDAPIAEWQVYNSPTRWVALNADGTRLATSAGGDGTVKVWNPATGEPTLVIPEAARNCSIEAIAFHPSLPLLAVSGVDWRKGRDSDGAVVVWNVETRQCVHTFVGGASKVTFSPDGEWVAAVSLFESISIWDLESGKLHKEVSARTEATNAIAFSPDGAQLAAGSDDGGLRFWETGRFELVNTFDLESAIKDLLFAPDGRSIITGNGNSACYVVGV